MCPTSGGKCGHTGNDIAGIHSILVFDESKSVHELDLRDLPSAMGVEVSFNIGLGRCDGSAES